MRVVLYTDDMEPITVIDLPALAEGYLNERGMVRLAVQLPPLLSVLAAADYGDRHEGTEQCAHVRGALPRTGEDCQVARLRAGGAWNPRA